MPKDYLEWHCLWYQSLIAFLEIDQHKISGDDFEFKTSSEKCHYSGKQLKWSEIR